MQKRLFLTPLAIILFILYFTVFGDRGLLRINHLHRDLDEMQLKLQDLKGENEKLRREIEALQSDRRYLESIARRDFGLVRGNEVIYQFPTPPGQSGAQSHPASQGQPAPSQAVPPSQAGTPAAQGSSAAREKVAGPAGQKVAEKPVQPAASQPKAKQ